MTREIQVDETVTQAQRVADEENAAPARVLAFRSAHPWSLAAHAWLSRGIFACLCFIALFTLRSALAVRWAFRIAFALWIVQLLMNGRKFEKQPFVLPSLLFLSTAGISAAFSYSPLLSWERMGWFTLLPLSIIVAQNVRTMRQVRILVVLIMIAAGTSALLTGWQYSYGIGTELVNVPRNSALARAGLRSGDLVQSVNGHRTRTPEQWAKVVESTRNEQSLNLHIARGAPVNYYDLRIPRNGLQQWLDLPGASVRRGRPVRAQGHMYHYMPYAGVMLQLGLLAFGLLGASAGKGLLSRGSLGLLFAAIAAALAATVTRVYMAGLIVGCFIQFWLLHKKWRMAAVAAVLLCAVGSTLFIEKERGYGWLAMGDPGTEYRVAMWKDAPQLILQHPFFGIGPDSVLQEGARWKLKAYKQFGVTSHFHSSYIELAVDCGLPCLAAWLWLMGSYLFWLARTWKSSKNWDWFQRGMLLGVAAGAIGFMLAGFVQYALGDGEVMILIWMFMGILVAMARICQDKLFTPLAQELNRPTLPESFAT